MNTTDMTSLAYTSPVIFSNNVMSLSMVLTIQPWFLDLVQKLKNEVPEFQQNVSSFPNEHVNLNPEKLLSILGYWPCDSLEKPAVTLVELATATSEGINQSQCHATPRELTHDSHTKSVCLKGECKQCSQDSKDSSLNKSDHRKDDEFLLDVHPNEVKYITNPKTGRNVKKIVCMVPGWGKAFDKKWNFKDHIRMHMGEKPYQCERCDKSFTQKGNLAKHMRQHEFKDLKTRKVHQCEVCMKKFTEKYNLKVRILHNFW